MKNPDKHAGKIQELAENVVKTMFEMFQDPKNQGKNFSWDNFPEITKNLARSYAASTFFRIPINKIAIIEDKVGELAFKLAQEKVEESQKKSCPKL